MQHIVDIKQYLSQNQSEVIWNVPVKNELVRVNGKDEMWMIASTS